MSGTFEKEMIPEDRNGIHALIEEVCPIGLVKWFHVRHQKGGTFNYSCVFKETPTKHRICLDIGLTDFHSL